MDAFVHVITYKYDIFAVTGNDHIWRIWFEGNQPMMERLYSPFEDEHYNAVRLLRAMKDLYK